MERTENVEKVPEDLKNRRELAKAMGGNLVPVTVELFDPYVKFAKEYMQFFNVHDSFEIFLMRLIYNELERLHRGLTEYVESKDARNFVDGSDWYAKDPHVACTSTQISDDKENDC